MTTPDTDAEIERLEAENAALTAALHEAVTMAGRYKNQLRFTSRDLSRAQGLIDAKFPYRVPAILNQIQTDIADTLASKYKEN